MVPDVRSSGGSLGGEFNLNSPAGVISVLTAIRISNISQEQRNELRDLVFLYTRGGDAAVGTSLITQLTEYKIGPVVVAATEVAPTIYTSVTALVEESLQTNPPQPSFVQSRPVPRFTAPAILPVLSTETVSTSAPTVVLPTMTPDILTVEAEKVAVVPVIDVIPQARASFEIDTSKIRAARIQEIKLAVNNAFGNPVNLVDIDNSLGREYMSALLEAMKLSPDVAVESSAPVMERLETIFKLVAARVEMNDAGAYPQLTKTAPPSIPPVIVAVKVPDVVLPTTVSSRIVPIPVRVRDISVESASVMPSVPVTEGSESVPAALPITEFDLSPIVTVENSPVEETPFIPPPLQSVAASPVLKTLADLPASDALERSSVEGDALFTKDIDDGLDQLLSEWSLFKKSGMFGTGPKGHLHPLFMKLASLQIPLIMSGRFEGSSEEIKQSISDYMNGWRYEQGIIFENSETFEHYLRRVIRHIIDLQKKRRGS